MQPEGNDPNRPDPGAVVTQSITFPIMRPITSSALNGSNNGTLIAQTTNAVQPACNRCAASAAQHGSAEGAATMRATLK